MTETYSEYLTTKQAATYINISHQWLEIGRHNGYGPPFIKLGRSVRYKRTDLDDFMERHRRAKEAVREPL